MNPYWTNGQIEMHLEAGMDYRSRQVAKLTEHFEGRKFQGQWRKNARAESVRRLLWKLQHGRCFYCTGQMRSPTIDHYIPKVAGGASLFANLVYACERCNQAKADNVPVGNVSLPLADTRFAGTPDAVTRLQRAAGKRGGQIGMEVE